MPIAISEITKEYCQQLKGIFTDIDDTVSWQGKIPAEAYQALWNAKEAGLKTILITGRPAGWVDHFARMWPVDAVIGENGAFYFYLDPSQGRDGLLKQRFVQDKGTRKTNTKKLWEVFHDLKKTMPKLQVASDQNYRAIDLAVDFCEDVPRMTETEIDQIVAAFTAAGAQAKISSIHVNAWFGKHDKFSCCKLLLEELFQENIQKEKEHYLYFGDSPNDEPLFKEFPHTVGVANVSDFLEKMQYQPTYITSKSGGYGFHEALMHILQHR